LVLLDAPDYDFSDFYTLVDSQTEKTYDVGSRAFKKFFASMNLLSVLIIHYSRENNNLYPARECVTFLLLRVWSWILKNALETKQAVLKEFRKLLKIHFNLLDEYFKKTSVAVEQENGLFSETGKLFEYVGYPLRCFEHINYLIYYFYARLYFPEFETEAKGIRKQKLVHMQTEYLANLVSLNEGCQRPLLDYHSIAIVNIVLFLSRNQNDIPNYKELITDYLTMILDNVTVIKNTRDRLPEIYNNIEALTEFAAKNKRPHSYHDESSLLLTYIFELLALIGDEANYQFYTSSFKDKVNLQMAYCNLPTEELEILLFQKNLNREMHVKAGIKFPEKIVQYLAEIANDAIPERCYRTDIAGFPFLRMLAGIYFKNEFLPDEWRNKIKWS
jgi:hypothetical protein